MSKSSKIKFDKWLIVLFLLLIVVGQVMFFSVSTAASVLKGQDSLFFFMKQLYYGVLPGFLVLIIASRVDYRIYAKLSPFLMIISLVLLAVLEIDGVGKNLNGAVRWIDFGSFVFQPSEFAKISMILFFSHVINKKNQHLKHFWQDVLPLVVILCGYAFLLIRQPDAGTMLATLLTGFVMIFIAGINWKYFAYLGGVFVMGFAIVTFTSPYRMQRLVSYFDHTVDTRGANYHLNQSLIAIGSGGLLGKGYGMSDQKNGYLPEILNDSIFAVISEELGFLRASGIVLIFVAICARIFYFMYTLKDGFARFICLGIGSHLLVHIVINIGAMIKLLPLTGIPLPFFSQGNSSYLITMAMVGILFNATRK